MFIHFATRYQIPQDLFPQLNVIVVRGLLVFFFLYMLHISVFRFKPRFHHAIYLFLNIAIEHEFDFFYMLISSIELLFNRYEVHVARKTSLPGIIAGTISRYR